MINIQPIEKRLDSDGSVLEVHSVFYTIQGEGPFCGSPAVFIRLAGCNLQCPSCDTDYTSQRDIVSVKELLTVVNMHYRGNGQNKFVVITGGEPLRQNIGPLVKALDEQNFTVQVETNGTLPVPTNLTTWNVHFVCSPKTGKIHPGLLDWIMAFKYVLSHDSVNPDDGLPYLALDHTASPMVARPPEGTLVYVQPMDSKDKFENDLNLKAAIASCMKFGYILQLQTHKIIGME